MNTGQKHSLNILETPFSTVTSAGHWFHATHKTVEDYVPGLLKKYSYESLITKAVVWIDSADSLAMILYFILAYVTDAWIASLIAFLFHYLWYQYKSGFVNIVFTPILSFFNKDLFQIAIAAIALSFFGIWEMYTELAFGILFFFLFKVGLLRRLWDKLDKRSVKSGLPLNDRVLKMILVRYSLYENMPPVQVESLEKHVQKAVIDFNTRNRK